MRFSPLQQRSSDSWRLRSLKRLELGGSGRGPAASLPGIGPFSAAMLIAKMPELGRMTAGEAAAMTGLAPVPHHSGTMRGKRAIAGRRQALRRAVFQAVLAAACHYPVLKPVAQRLKARGKPHKLVIVAVARRLVTIANASLKAGVPWRQNLAA